MGEIADELLARTRRTKDGKEEAQEKSIIGLLSMLIFAFHILSYILRKSKQNQQAHLLGCPEKRS